jgi:hypothetical protein
LKVVREIDDNGDFAVTAVHLLDLKASDTHAQRATLAALACRQLTQLAGRSFDRTHNRGHAESSALSAFELELMTGEQQRLLRALRLGRESLAALAGEMHNTRP